MFRRTTAVNKLLALTKRKRIIQGGTWGGKTYGIIAVLIDYAAKNPGRKITVVAETIPAVKEGALQQFREIMQKTGRWYEPRYNAVEMAYTFANTTKIQFKSFDTEGKAKAAGKRDVLFLNEANHIPFNIADALMIRTEGQIWIDFNPDNEFWAHTEVLPSPDAEFLLLKYTDNEGCPETIIQQLKQRQEQASTSSYWRNWCRVYIDGEIGTLEGVIYPDWKPAKEVPDIIRKEATVVYGLDFGFNVPTALVKVYLLKGMMYAEELLYETGLTNSDVITRILGMGIQRGAVMYCDAAEPNRIEELRRAGFNAKPADKDVKKGIDTIRQQALFITQASLNLTKEIRGYKYDSDKDGKLLEFPVKENDHAVDAMRYAAYTHLKSPSGVYHVR